MKDKFRSFLSVISIFLIFFTKILYCEAQQNVNIGLLAPLTGENKSIGLSISAAVKAALPEVNEYLALHNLQVTVLEKDTLSDPETAKTALKELEQEGVQIVIGPVLSSSAQTCLSYADSKNIILISPSSTSEQLSKKDCLFRMLPSDKNQGAVLAKYISSVNIQEVLPVYINDSYGKGLEDAFATKFKTQSGIVLKGLSFKANDLTKESLIEKIADSTTAFSAPDNAAILFIGYGDLNTFFENAAANETLKRYRWFTSEAFLANSPDFLDNATLADFAVKTSLATVSIQPNDIITDLYSLHIRQQSQAQLPEENTLSHFAYPSWNALWIAAEALKKISSGDASSLKQAVTELGSGDAFYGLRPLNWNKNGDSSNGAFYLLQPNAVGTDWATKAICEINPNWSEPNLKTVPSLTWPPANPPANISFHGLFPLSGGLDLTTAKEGFELAIQHINEYFISENINTTLTGTSHDTKTDPAEGLAIAQDLYNNFNVPILVGPCASSVVDNVKTGVPEICVVSPTSTALDLAEPDDYVARLCPTDSAQAEALSALITMDGVDKVVIIYRNDIWGHGIKTAFSNSFNGDIKTYEYNVETTDFTDLIEEVEIYMEGTLAEKKAVLLVSFDEAANIFDQIDEQSPLLSYSWYGTDGIANTAAMLADGPGRKAVLTGLQCSTYSPYIVDMLSPRLLLFNKWRSGVINQSADPVTVLAYDSTWLTVFAYMLNDTHPPQPAEVWGKLNEDAKILTGYSYANALNSNGDRISKYYSFYRLELENDVLIWKVANSYMKSDDETKSLKREGTIENKGKSSFTIKYKRNNYYENGIQIAEKEWDTVKATKLPLGDFRIPEDLILENGVMTDDLTVFVDGNSFPCTVNTGDWVVSEDKSRYIFTTSKSKMSEYYFPMSLKINQKEALWSFNTSHILLDKLDWSDGIEIRIDLDRQASVILNYKPELDLKLTFKNEINGIEYPSEAQEYAISKLGISKMISSYSTKSPWQGTFMISKSDLSTTATLNPVVSGVTLTANDNSWTVSAGKDWGGKTEQGIFNHKYNTGASKTSWYFDTQNEQWMFKAKGVNTIGIANSLIEKKGILLELNFDANNTSTILLKPKIKATLQRTKE